MNVSAKLPLRTKLSFGLGSAAFGIKDQGFNTLLMLYYNQVVGMPAAWVGAAILIATLIDAFADPLIGHASDHSRSRLGRRHPFMYASALPIAVAFVLLWSPPDASHSVQFSWLVITAVLARIGISLFEVPSAALMAEFTGDYHERTSLAMWRSLFMAIGLVGMNVLAFKVLLQPTPEQPVGQLNAAGYEHYGWVGAILMFICVLAATRGTQDRIPLLRSTAHVEQQGSLLTNLRLLLADRTYVSLVVCIFLWAIATGILTGLGTYVQTYFWKLSAAQIAQYVGAQGIGVILGLALLPLARKVGKKPMAMTAYSVALAAAVVMPVLGLLGVAPSTPDAALPWLVLSNVIVAATALIGIILGASMLADVADHLELKVGRRMEGLMFAALIMIQKAVSGAGVFLSSLILAFVRFPEKANPATIDSAIVDEMVLIYAVSITTLVSLAILSMHFYPITRQTHERTLAALGRPVQGI